MPLWLVALMAVLWGTSKPLPPKKHARLIAKGCAAYAPHGYTKKHLDRLIDEAMGRESGPASDPEFARKLLMDLSSDCADIRQYVREKLKS